MLCEFNSIHETISNSLSNLCLRHLLCMLHQYCMRVTPQYLSANVFSFLSRSVMSGRFCQADLLPSVWMVSSICKRGENVMFRNICKAFIMGAVSDPFLNLTNQVVGKSYNGVQCPQVCSLPCLQDMSQCDHQYFNLSLK